MYCVFSFSDLSVLTWGFPHSGRWLTKNRSSSCAAGLFEASSACTRVEILRARAHPKSLLHNLLFYALFHLPYLASGNIYAGWLFVPTRMSCSSCVMLFPKIRHTSALCYGFLEVNVFWMDLQQTVYSGRVRGEILFGFALTYQKQVWNPRHLWRVLRSECRRITTHLRSKAEWNGSSVWGAAA